MKTTQITRLITVISVLTLNLSAMAQPGTLDPTFNGTGYVVDTVKSLGSNYMYGFTPVSQPDSKVVVSSLAFTSDGYLARIIRYNADGSPDQTFGTGGYKDLDFNCKTFMPALALQPDGKIVAAGTAETPGMILWTVVRLNPDGSYDNGFGQNGIVQTHVQDSLEYTSDVKVLPDGKLLVSGELSGGTGNHLCMVRYLPDGAVDTTFGNKGIITTTISGGEFSMMGTMGLLDDGKIVLGSQISFGSRLGIALFRFHADGTTDGSFGQNGLALDTAGFNKGNYMLTTQSDGKIVVPAYVYFPDASHPHFSLLRYNADGSRDLTFADNGLYLGPGGAAYCAIVQNDGKIISSGNHFNDTTPKCAAIARFLPSGTPDPIFGNNGFFILYDSIKSGCANVCADPNGKILSSGYCNETASPSHRDLLLLRLNSFGLRIDESGDKAQLKISPNPFRDKILVEAAGMQGSTLTVTSMDGRTLETFTPDSDRETLELGRLQKGIYLLNIHSSSTSVCRRIIRR